MSGLGVCLIHGLKILRINEAYLVDSKQALSYSNKFESKSKRVCCCQGRTSHRVFLSHLSYPCLLWSCRMKSSLLVDFLSLCLVFVSGMGYCLPLAVAILMCLIFYRPAARCLGNQLELHREVKGNVYTISLHPAVWMVSCFIVCFIISSIHYIIFYTQTHYCITGYLSAWFNFGALSL